MRTSVLASSTQSTEVGVGVLVSPVLSSACAFAGLRAPPPEAEWLLLSPWSKGHIHPQVASGMRRDASAPHGSGESCKARPTDSTSVWS